MIQMLKNGSLTTMLALALVLGFSEVVAAQGSFGNAAAKAEFERGEAALKQQDYSKAAGAFRAAINLDPYFVDAHKNFIHSSMTVAILGVKSDLGMEERREVIKQTRIALNKEMIALYEDWAKKDPRNPAYQWALGELYRLDNNYDKREQYLLKAISLDQKFVPAYSDLANIAELRGDKNKQSQYLKKVAEYAPHDSSSLYYYARSLQDTDPDLYREKMLEVVNRFPNDERGAQALLQLAISADRAPERIAYYERLKAAFPPASFQYSNAGMPYLFDAYSASDPRKALALAQEMSRIVTQAHEKKMWQESLAYQQSVVRSQYLISQKHYTEAIASLEQSAAKKPPLLDAGGILSLLKAEAFSGAGQEERAYQELLSLATSDPTDLALDILRDTGAKLGKTVRQVKTDIRQSLEARAKPVKHFSLKRYGDDKLVSSADYPGKVVMLSFWFPTCAPCRIQNRQLKKILKKYGQDKLIILAINVRPEQDQFVLPYLRNNQLNFVPLRGSAEFARAEFRTTSYPTNFLIDRQGRMAFELGDVRGEKIRTLELQIEMLLE